MQKDRLKQAELKAKKVKEKTCTKCGLDKPVSEDKEKSGFSQDGIYKGKPKYHSQCKECMANNYARCANCHTSKKEPEMIYYVRVDLPSAKFAGLGTYMCSQRCADTKWEVVR